MKIAVLSMGLLVVGAARADEQKVDVKDLPKPVLAAVKAKFPEAKLAGAAKEEGEGKTVYEVAIEDDEQAIDLAITPKGKVLEVEKAVAPKKLPTPVKAAVEARYPKAKIKKAEEVLKYDDEDEDDDDEDEDEDGDDEDDDKKKAEKTFEVVLSGIGESDVEVKLTPKGKFIDGDEDEDEDGDKKAGKQAKNKKKGDGGGKKGKKGEKEDKE